MKIDKNTFNFFLKNLQVSDKTAKSNPQTFKGRENNFNNLYPQGINYWIEVHRPAVEDLNGVEKTTLKNKVVLNFDKNSPENKIAFELRSKPTERVEANPAVKQIYAQMMKYDKLQGNNDTGADLLNGERLEIASLWDKKDFPDVLKETLQKAYNPNFTEKQLNDEKTFILSEFDYMQEDSVYKRIYGTKPYTKEDVEKVTLDDVKKFHNDMVQSYMTLCSVSAPKDTDETTIRQIKNIIETQIPEQKPFDVKSVTNRILPIEQSVTIRSKTEKGDLKSIGRFYTIKVKDTLKDAVTLEFIGQALKKIMQNNISKEIKDFGCFCTGSYWDKYFEIYASAGDKNADFDDCINSAIKTITEKPLDDKFFEGIRQDMINGRKESLKYSRERAGVLSELYTDGTYGLKEYNDILNSLTPDEIHKTAQECFNRSYITEIRE